MKIMLQVASRTHVVFFTVSREDRMQADHLLHHSSHYRDGTARLVLMKKPFPNLGRHYER